MAKRKEHFEYDGILQSGENGDNVQSRHDVSYRCSRSWCFLRAVSLSVSFFCVIVLLVLVLSWGVPTNNSHDDDEMMDQSILDQVVKEHPQKEVDSIVVVEQSSDDVPNIPAKKDVSGFSRPHKPLYATKATVKEIHGTLSGSFYDPSPSTDTPSSFHTCNDQGVLRGYVCIGDRLGNSERLARGTAMCSRHGRYMFGMDRNGSLVWRDCFVTNNDDNIDRVYYKGNGDDGEYFVMKDDATFVVSNEEEEEEGGGALKWTRECKFKVGLTPQCLGKPMYDCPYLHLHKEGTLVLNWIDEGGRWRSKGVNKLYSF
mmetsp:Transcript_13816/g.29650  ORF Transcript_13816/g.29650 Transcript_13816/m.29650 type:complete len:314 (+) Transcript_13816:191-1132(+)